MWRWVVAYTSRTSHCHNVIVRIKSRKIRLVYLIDPKKNKEYEKEEIFGPNPFYIWYISQPKQQTARFFLKYIYIYLISYCRYGYRSMCRVFLDFTIRYFLASYRSTGYINIFLFTDDDFDFYWCWWWLTRGWWSWRLNAYVPRFLHPFPILISLFERIESLLWVLWLLLCRLDFTETMTDLFMDLFQS